MIDHIGITVSDYEKSQAFYLAALAPLGYELLMEVTGAGPHAGFGEPGKPDFWIGPGVRTAPKMHVAFRAEDRATVRAFHDAGGGRNRQRAAQPARDLSSQLLRRLCGRPHGHNIEAVCHDPE